MFVPIFGSANKPEFAGHTLVLPCVSAGMSALIGLDLYILNEPNMKKIGYYSSEHLAPGLSNDGLSPVENSGVITLPGEIFNDPTAKLTFLNIRSGPVSGQSRKFGAELTQFIKTHNFKDVVILSSTLSPVNRERHSNRL
jgi:predicted ATP-grasp superfamily ATP-dependent carboligase